MYLDQAMVIAKKSIKLFTKDGYISEKNKLGSDAIQFKGIFVKCLAEFILYYE